MKLTAPPGFFCGCPWRVPFCPVFPPEAPCSWPRLACTKLVAVVMGGKMAPWPATTGGKMVKGFCQNGWHGERVHIPPKGNTVHSAHTYIFCIFISYRKPISAIFINLNLKDFQNAFNIHSPIPTRIMLISTMHGHGLNLQASNLLISRWRRNSSTWTVFQQGGPRKTSCKYGVISYNSTSRSYFTPVTDLHGHL